MLSRRNSSLLELEAASYFKLNTCQVDLLTRSNQRLECFNDPSDIFTSSGNKNNAQREGSDSKTYSSTKGKQKKKHQIKSSEIHSAQDGRAKLYKTSPNRCRNQLSTHQTASTDSLYVRGKASTRRKRSQRQQKSRFENTTKENYHKRTMSTKYLAQRKEDEAPVLASSYYLANSSTTSTSSLPSISSSPSVSPSLVCPHVSLDDILQIRDKYGAKSPHTIGLCKKCRLDPPPNIQSPLSPAFKPSNSAYSDYKCSSGYDSKYLSKIQSNSAVKRVLSDRDLSWHNQVNAKAEQDEITTASRLSNSNLRDDSLDYFLDPKELQRLQLSPTLRNSVEYIRNNSIEAGRVVKIYQNGKPFDKPLRICICRNEFSNLNHLLDHINSRQLIPSGARYLFHINGQLVYSVHELKHGSAYFVSGTRTFDLQASNKVKEQLDREFFRHYQTGAQKHPNSYLIDYHEKALPRSSSNIELKRRETIYEELVPKSSKASNSTKAAYTAKGRDDYDPEVSERQSKVLNQPKAMVQERHPSKLTNYKATRAEAAYEPAGTRESHVIPENVGFNTDSLEPETISMSKSDDNLTIDRILSDDTEKPVASLVRAKSEMSAARPNKRKKNVTFKDTGRGSSPLIPTRSVSYSNSQSISRADPVVTKSKIVGSASTSAQRAQETGRASQTSPSIPKIESKEMRAINTNEIGIQVSDSIEGFLIDLPLPLPGKRDEDERRVTYLRKGSGLQASSRVNSNTNNSTKRSPKRTTTVITRQINGNNSKSISRQTTGAGNKRKQIVTISERQLSLEEMSKLEDIDHGDHHNEAHKIRRVTIKLESMDDSSNKTEESLETIQESGSDRKDKVSLDKSKTSSESGQDMKEGIQVRDGNEKHWEYPGGRVASATPTERPISQSEANKAIHARVITPTPSISTQDNLSLSGSLAARNESQLSSLDGFEQSLASRVKLPVMGILRNGIDTPSKNFRLVWVNGFAINDQYPENSATALGTKSLLDGNSSVTITRTNKSEGPLLSPSSSYKLKSGHPAQGPLVFRPSERFHNWVCYSSKYDELIYPTGNLVLLWCRWNNEQRYYSKHTTNISCLTLASLDNDLIGSAQLYDENENINSLIHLWSLSSLETLFVIDYNHFKLQKIFSLKVKNTRSDGCQVLVGAKDDKRFWLYRINLKLNDKGQQDVEEMEAAKTKQTKSKQRQLVNKVTVMKSDKALQPNHIPLLVMSMSNARTTPEVAKSSDSDSKPSKSIDDQLDNLTLSFGRKHFQIWATNLRQEKLCSIPYEHKSAQFTSTIVKANCLARISPSEYVVGDSDGSINLLIISIADGKSVSQLGSSDSSAQKCRVETILLLKPSTSPSDSKQSLPGSSPTRSPSITCLARVSGNLFASSDSTCTIKVWRINRQKKVEGMRPEVKSSKSEEKNAIVSNSISQNISCNLVSCVSLPNDLGFICSIVLAKYNRKMSLVEFYVVSTSNAILFGSVKLDSANSIQVQEESRSDNASSNQLSSFAVVYEGHESSASNLVADYPKKAKQKSSSPSAMNETSELGEYFTCSLDFRICKWSYSSLLWKSMLPSSCSAMAVHPSVLAIGSADGTVYILDKISGLLISYFPLTPVCINCLAYSKDGLFLAAGCANGSIFILPVYDNGLKYKKVSIFQVSSV